MNALEINPEAAALVFDIDGTLADTTDLHRKAWKQALRKHDIDMSDEFFSSHFGKPTEEWLIELNRTGGLQLSVEQLSMEKDQAYIQHVPLAKPIMTTLDLVHRHSGELPMAVGTNEGLAVATMVLRTIGLAGAFATVVSIDDVGTGKPDPAIFLECARRMNVEPERCQVFEDSDVGLQAAERAGMIVTDVRPHLSRA